MNNETPTEHEYETFHEATKLKRIHAISRSRRILNYMNLPRYILETARNRKAYRNSPNSKLPEPCPSKKQFHKVLTKRASQRRFAPDTLTFEQISTLLQPALGVQRKSHISVLPNEAIGFRSYPSGGGLYPVEFYILGRRVDGEEPFVAHYNPADNSISMIRQSTTLEKIDEPFIYVDKAQSYNSMIVVMTAISARSTTKYGERGYRLALIEAGHAAQNICLNAEALNLGAVAWAGFYDDDLEKLLHIDGVNESVVHAVIVGHKDSELVHV